MSPRLHRDDLDRLGARVGQLGQVQRENAALVGRLDLGRIDLTRQLGILR